jgi:hypothetical protein
MDVKLKKNQAVQWKCLGFVYFQASVWPALFDLLIFRHSCKGRNQAKK